MSSGGNNNQNGDQPGCPSFEVISERDETTFATNSAQGFPVGSENTSKGRRPKFRPYASSSNRIVKKSGKSNVITRKIPNKNFRYTKDIGNTLHNIRWRWVLAILCIADGIAYVTYGAVWMLVATINGDNENNGNVTGPCIIGTKSFAGYFILSVGTISTIGSGTIFPGECQLNWIIMMLQTLTGVIIEGALVTAVFVKMARPYKRDPMRLFSRRAVICLRDGALCLIFRVRDISGKHWAKTTMKAGLIKRRDCLEGEALPYYFENLELEKHGLLCWPQEIVHNITQESPLWSMCAENFYKFRFEILVTLEGDSISTGQPCQSQTSYTNREILWGHRFVPCVEYDKMEHKYVVRHDKFNDVQQFETPLCSAQELSGLLKGVLTPSDGWDFDITSAVSTPCSRRNAASVLKCPSYRMTKSDIDGIPKQSPYTRQCNGVTLETKHSEWNLKDSNASLDKDKKWLKQ